MLVLLTLIYYYPNTTVHNHPLYSLRFLIVVQCVILLTKLPQ